MRQAIDTCTYVHVHMHVQFVTSFQIRTTQHLAVTYAEMRNSATEDGPHEVQCQMKSRQLYCVTVQKTSHVHFPIHFYRAMLCIRGTSNGPVSVRLSVTSRCSTKMAKRRITQTIPHDSPGTVVFWCQRSLRNSTGVTSPPTGASNAGGVGQNWRLSTNNRLYLENGTR